MTQHSTINKTSSKTRKQSWRGTPSTTPGSATTRGLNKFASTKRVQTRPQSEIYLKLKTTQFKNCCSWINLPMLSSSAGKYWLTLILLAFIFRTKMEKMPGRKRKLSRKWIFSSFNRSNWRLHAKRPMSWWREISIRFWLMNWPIGHHFTNFDLSWSHIWRLCNTIKSHFLRPFTSRLSIDKICWNLGF